MTTKPNNNNDEASSNGENVSAIYTKKDIPDYDGNPLIEALPDILTREQLYKKLRYDIPYDDAQRKFPQESRIHLLYECRRFFKPYDQVISLGLILSVSIMSAYVPRNPLRSDYFHKAKDNQGK